MCDSECRYLTATLSDELNESLDRQRINSNEIYQMRGILAYILCVWGIFCSKLWLISDPAI